MINVKTAVTGEKSALHVNSASLVTLAGEQLELKMG